MRADERQLSRNSERKRKDRKRKKNERFLRSIVIAALCAGVVLQAVLFMRLAGKYGECAGIEAQINQLDSDVVNYQVAIGSNGDREAIRSRAEKVLGMVEPDADHIRVVNVPLNDSEKQLVMNETP